MYNKKHIDDKSRIYTNIIYIFHKNAANLLIISYILLKYIKTQSFDEHKTERQTE